MAEETIIIHGETHKIEVRPITLIVKNSHVGDVSYPTRLVLDPVTTVEHARTMRTTNVVVERLFRLAFKKYTGEVTPDAIRATEHIGMLHVLGLIDLSVQCILNDMPFVWKYPETYLHPEIQAELGDVLIELALGRKDGQVPTDA